jgi:hypothetical protein
MSYGGLVLLDDNLVDRPLPLVIWSHGAIQSNGSRYVASTLSGLVLRGSECLFTVLPCAGCQGEVPLEV